MDSETLAIQDQIPGNHCFGCGPLNSGGLQIKSYWRDDDTTLCRFEPHVELCAGPVDVLNGGIIATLIDCHSICTAIAHAYRSEQRAIGSTPTIWFVTAALTIDYMAPTPIGEPVFLLAEITAAHEKKSIVRCQLRSGEEICAKAEVIAVRVPGDWR